MNIHQTNLFANRVKKSKYDALNLHNSLNDHVQSKINNPLSSNMNTISDMEYNLAQFISCNIGMRFELNKRLIDSRCSTSTFSVDIVFYDCDNNIKLILLLKVPVRSLNKNSNNLSNVVPGEISRLTNYLDIPVIFLTIYPEYNPVFVSNKITKIEKTTILDNSNMITLYNILNRYEIKCSYEINFDGLFIETYPCYDTLMEKIINVV